MHAVSRLALHPHITNIQASWTKMGHAGALTCLQSGANDLGGTLMNESISRAAGASHGQELTPPEMERLIRSIGRQPQQRNSRYQPILAETAVAAYRRKKNVIWAQPWIDLSSRHWLKNWFAMV